MPTLDPTQIATLAYHAGFRGQDLVNATAIAMAESGGQTDIHPVDSNGKVSYGLFQLNAINPQISNADLDPVKNATDAYAMFQKDGFSPWSTYNSGAYQTHLSAAETAASQVEADPVGLWNKFKHIFQWGGGRYGQIPGVSPGAPGTPGQPSLIIPKQITNFFSSIGRVFDALDWIIVPSNLIRLALGFAGVVSFGAGIWIMKGEL